ncbi:MAG TPA: LytR C-terminal domain-containing protein [Mycobacteriales bacterium]|nr:LytR C-terminal domain-containing protein [Mycobacteriales bacterium]
MAAISLVAGAILGLNLAFGGSAPPRPPGQGPVVAAPSVRTSAPTAAAAPDAASASPGATAPVGASPATPSPAPAASPGVEERPPLTVLNHSRRPKLAQRAADRFRAGGWRIAEVGNTRRTVVETTVFYEPGGEDAAALLRRQFPEVRAAAPRPADLPGRGLTVVVTREFPA